MEWIKCTEGQMPEDDKRYKSKSRINVLVTTQNGRVTKVQRIHNTFNRNDYWYWGRIYNGIKAWMPLPEPYKENIEV